MWVALLLLLLPLSASMNAVASSFQPAVGAGAGEDGVGDIDELAASAVATGSVSEGRRGELAVAEELVLAAEAMKNDMAKDDMRVRGCRRARRRADRLKSNQFRISICSSKS